MTFRKKDPELVTIFCVSNTSEPKTRVYRVSKCKEFVDSLQVKIKIVIIHIVLFYLFIYFTIVTIFKMIIGL